MSSETHSPQIVSPASHVSANVIRHQVTVTRPQREAQNGHRSAIVWFTGLSGSGKSTLAHAVDEYLYQNGYRSLSWTAIMYARAFVAIWDLRLKTVMKI